MSRYKIRIEPTEECNPEYGPDTDLMNGMDVDGFIMIGFKDKKPYFESIMGISVADIKNWIRKRQKGAQLMRQGVAIAEGEIRAEEIMNEKEDKGIELGSITLEPQQPISKEMIRKIFGLDS